LADLLLDPQSVPAELRQHVESCAECGRDLAELRATMGMLDDWAVPEANPFFDAKLMARLRTEQESRPASLWEKWKARFVYGSRLRMQPLMAGALGIVVLIGGGTYADIYWQGYHNQESAAVRDLRSLDDNAQVFQQLDSVDQAATQDDQNSGTTAPTSD